MPPLTERSIEPLLPPLQLTLFTVVEADGVPIAATTLGPFVAVQLFASVMVTVYEPALTPLIS